MKIWNDNINLPKLESGKAQKLNQILFEVANENGIPVFMIKGKRRFQDLVNARRQFVVRAKKETDAALKEIGSVIGRDHSTVINLMKWTRCSDCFQ